MTYQSLSEIGVTVMIAVLTYWETWRKWGSAAEVRGEPDIAKKFLGIKFARGFDGNWRLMPLPFHLRVALSLISALLSAIFTIYLYRLFALI